MHSLLSAARLHIPFGKTGAAAGLIEVQHENVIELPFNSTVRSERYYTCVTRT